MPDPGFVEDGIMLTKLLKYVVVPLVVLSFLSLTGGAQQVPSVAPAPAVPAPADPLMRDTPRGCIMGFIDAAHQENYQLAARYFQTTLYRTPRKQDEELAQQLMTFWITVLLAACFPSATSPMVSSTMVWRRTTKRQAK